MNTRLIRWLLAWGGLLFLLVGCLSPGQAPTTRHLSISAAVEADTLTVTVHYTAGDNDTTLVKKVPIAVPFMKDEVTGEKL